MSKIKAILFTVIFLSFIQFCVPPVWAKLGVGVGTGKIVIDEDLKPGMVYQLPTLNVINTGTEASDYGVMVAYHESQVEEKPSEDWFEFTPASFHLEPGQAEAVEIWLKIPIKAKPGNYFAYLKGFPHKVSDNGTTAIGIAAAAKLQFTIAPASFLTGIYYRLGAFWQRNQPWTTIIVGIISFTFIVSLMKKFFSLELKVKKKDDENIAH